MMNKTNQNIVVLGILFLSLLIIAGCGRHHRTETRKITVQGTGEIKLAPEQVVINLGIETRDKNLDLARQQNMERATKVIVIIKKAGIEEKDIKTDNLRIGSDYHFSSSGTRIFDGYQVQNSIQILLKDFSRLEMLLSEATKSGVNEVNGLDFQIADFPKTKSEARKLAIKAAREKAEKIAAELGQKIGKPLEILEEDGSYGDNRYRGNFTSVNSNAIRLGSDSATESSSGISAGLISVNATLRVTFELVD